MLAVRALARAERGDAGPVGARQTRRRAQVAARPRGGVGRARVTCVASLPLGAAAPCAHELAFNHNGKMLAAAGADGEIVCST